jgi:hypothetical protein
MLRFSNSCSDKSEPLDLAYLVLRMSGFDGAAEGDYNVYVMMLLLEFK